MHASSNTKKVNFTLVGKNGKMGKAVAALAETDPEFELALEGDVVIDFSSPEGTRAAIAMGKPLVCGTTGLGEEIFESMRELATRVPVLYSPNFSLGICLLFEMMEAFAEKLKRFGSVSIEEIHHTEKRDSPSGTALKLGHLLGIDEIEAKRQGDVVGIHQVKVSFDSEELLIRHESHSREVFARGALNCAKFLLTRPPKMYQLSDIFIDDVLIKGP